MQVPDPSAEAAGPLEMSWKMVSAGALEEPHPPTKLRRTSSVAGNVLVVETDEGKKAYWLQRKITEESHTPNYVRIGFPLELIEYKGDTVNSSWKVKKKDEGSMYPFEMVAVKVQNSSNVFPGDGGNGNSRDLLDCGSEHSHSSTSTRSRNPKNEISALQMVSSVTDTEGKGNVLGAELVCNDEVQVYIILPLCKEGALLDLIGSKEETKRLEEAEARTYFRHILNVSVSIFLFIVCICVHYKTVYLQMHIISRCLITTIIMCTFCLGTGDSSEG